MGSTKSKELAAFRYHLYLTITLMVILILQVSMFQSTIRSHQELIKGKMDVQHGILHDILATQVKMKTILESAPPL